MATKPTKHTYLGYAWLEGADIIDADGWRLLVVRVPLSHPVHTRGCEGRSLLLWSGNEHSEITTAYGADVYCYWLRPLANMALHAERQIEKLVRWELEDGV